MNEMKDLVSDPRPDPPSLHTMNSGFPITRVARKEELCLIALVAVGGGTHLTPPDFQEEPSVMDSAAPPVVFYEKRHSNSCLSRDPGKCRTRWTPI